jgi:hypothetical protein
MARRAVILRQTDDAGVLVLAFKAEDVFDRRAAKFVDALIIIADDADVLASAGERARQQVL